MIDQFLLISSVIVIYEFISRIEFGKIIKSNFDICQKIINLFKFKKASDFRKQKLILKYSKSLLFKSFQIFFILFSILILIISFNFINKTFLNLIFSIFGIIEMTIFFLIYHLIKKKNE